MQSRIEMWVGLKQIEFGLIMTIDGLNKNSKILFIIMLGTQILVVFVCGWQCCNSLKLMKSGCHTWQRVQLIWGVTRGPALHLGKMNQKSIFSSLMCSLASTFDELILMSMVYSLPIWLSSQSIIQFLLSLPFGLLFLCPRDSKLCIYCSFLPSASSSSSISAKLVTVSIRRTCFLSGELPTSSLLAGDYSDSLRESSQGLVVTEAKLFFFCKCSSYMRETEDRCCRLSSC